jgi:ABC-2 type transport system ATP-binding protein
VVDCELHRRWPVTQRSLTLNLSRFSRIELIKTKIRVGLSSQIQIWDDGIRNTSMSSVWQVEKETAVRTIEISHIAKRFGETTAVADVSLEVERGEIFGLLGPNGAGKTTTIRMMLDIFRPDVGEIRILGGPMSEEKTHRIGYMPEERGLYLDIPLDRCLLYLASLKGVPTVEARQRLATLLDRFDLTSHKNKCVKELSKGMQQKAQIISTILHRPELVIIDEPFTALDPVNTQLVKELLRELRQQETTILMSTHQMHQVEELCDHILLIAKGRDVLHGNLDDVRRQFAGHAVLVRVQGEVPLLTGVEHTEPYNGDVKLRLNEETTPQHVLQQLMAKGIAVEKFEIAVPTLDEIFIRVVEGGE